MAKFKKGDRVIISKLDEGDLRRSPFLRVGLLGNVLDNNSSVPFVMVDGIGKVVLGENQLESFTKLQPNTITLILGNTAYEITGENITIKTKQLWNN